MVTEADIGRREWLRLWAWILAVSCVGMVALVVVVLWIMNGFHGLGLAPPVLAALILGTMGATGLSVALMGLLFYSDRSGIDAAVRDASTEEAARAPGERDSISPPTRSPPESTRSRERN
jgi:hypothetical protein